MASREYEQFKQAFPERKLGTIRSLLSTYPSLPKQTDLDLKTLIFHLSEIQDEDFSLAVLDALFEKGADPHHLDIHKETVLYYLARYGRARVMERLLSQHSYDLNRNDVHLQTPLFFAAREGKLKVVEMLLKYGANVNHLDLNSESALFFAASEGHLEMCKFLINRGSNPFLVDAISCTPLIFAKKKGHFHVVDYINGLKKGAHTSASFSKQPIKPPKKKDVKRTEYLLVSIAEDASMREVTTQQFQAFQSMGGKFSQAYEYINNPDLIEALPMSEESYYRGALKVINNLLRRQDCSIFAEPVDGALVPTYHNIIDKPMDFGTIKTKLNLNYYESAQGFKRDIELVLTNCEKFNGMDSQLGALAALLRSQVGVMYQNQRL